MDKTGQQVTREFVADRTSLMAFIRGMVRDHHVAEDIFQEVWLRLASAVENGVAIENSATWSRGVARNLILHHWRASRKATIPFDEELLGIVNTAFEEQDAQREYWQARAVALMDCLAKVPPASQKLLAMRYDGGLPIAEIAGRSGKSVPAITQFLSRLRQKLHECAQRSLRMQGYAT